MSIYKLTTLIFLDFSNIIEQIYIVQSDWDLREIFLNHLLQTSFNFFNHLIISNTYFLA